MGDRSLLAVRVRSGLEETAHHGAVAVSGADGKLIAYAGDIDRPFYLRSAAKPFQAHVSQEAGAALNPLQLAVASASHRGHPVHIALVETILEGAGIDGGSLSCPRDWPLDAAARQRLNVIGQLRPRRIWHNCSGKHAAFLSACVSNGWPLRSYLDPDHPLQKRILSFVSDLGEYQVTPAGVDGCGAPVMRTTVRAMSRLYARLACDPALTGVFSVMHRYPALVSGNGRGDATIAAAINAVAKIGAQGCVGVGVSKRLGLAVKSWDGLEDVAIVGAVEALRTLGELTTTATEALGERGRPEVYGGESVVGHTETRLELEHA